MSKLVSWIAVLLLLVIVPFGSWVYLSKGLNYRKSALAELKPKDSISIKLDTLNLFAGKTTLLVLQNQGSDEIVNAIEEQFKNAQALQVLYKDSTKLRSYVPNNYLGGFFEGRREFAFALIDKDLLIRNYYSLDIESVKKMIEHIAIIMPRPKELDIEQKINNN